MKLPADGAEIRAIRGGEIGLVFQEPMSSLSAFHSVGNQLIEAIRLHAPLSKRAARTRAIELLAMVGIPRPAQRVDAYSFELSGGLRQRVMIALALAAEPRILIADEPTTALDVTTQAQILDLIRRLQQERGLAVILITHDMGVIAEMTDDVVVMYLGHEVEKGPVDAIFHAPRHPYTQSLLQSIPSVLAEPRARLATIAGSIPHPYARPSGCPFHPRCHAYIAGVCEKSFPAEVAIADRHDVACHRVIREIGERRETRESSPSPRGRGLGEGGGNGSWHRPLPPPPSRKGRGSDCRRAHMTPVLDVRALRKYYPIHRGLLGRLAGQVRAVDDVSFSIARGETLSLVGESGCGKTTTSRCILRAVTPTSGEIRFRTESGAEVDVAGLPRKALRPLRRQMQMIFQDPFSSLNPRMTIAEIIGEPLLVNGMTDTAARNARVAELLELVHLPAAYLNRFPHAFSGGQRQRIGIARALALSPSLIVADEPVSALDVSVQAQIVNLMLELQDRLGMAYLFVAHDLSVVKHVSHRVAVMYVGKIVEIAPTTALFTSPRHPYTEALLSAVPVPDPRRRAQRIVLEGDVADPSDPPPGCAFHPRCRYAIERCKQEVPALEEVAPGHWARCIRARELNLASTVA